MIRINLLYREKKKVRRVDRSQQSVALGAMAVLAVGGVLGFLVVVPKQGELDDLEAKNRRLEKENKDLANSPAIMNLEAMRRQAEAADEQARAVDRLDKARATPAWLLYEISSILTRSHMPTMTEEMQARVLGGDSHRRFNPTWDPKRVWLISLDEKAGDIELRCGAQADSDVTQFALRLQASAYFDAMSPSATTSLVDATSRVTYYQFTIRGKVRY